MKQDLIWAVPKTVHIESLITHLQYQLYGNTRISNQSCKEFKILNCYNQIPHKSYYAPGGYVFMLYFITRTGCTFFINILLPYQYILVAYIFTIYTIITIQWSPKVCGNLVDNWIPKDASIGS